MLRKKLMKAFPAPDLRREAAKTLQIRARPPEVLRKCSFISISLEERLQGNGISARPFEGVFYGIGKRGSLSQRIDVFSLPRNFGILTL